MAGPGARVRHERFHGRVRHQDGRRCEWAGCSEPGEFRAPKTARSTQKEAYSWYCLEHVRAFNGAYDFFKDKTPEEIAAAQDRSAPWEPMSRFFTANTQTDRFDPTKVDIHDPMGILRDLPGFGAQFSQNSAHGKGTVLTPKDRQSLNLLGLDTTASLNDIKKQYKLLARRYHPDSNGGNRQYEQQLRKIIDAYTHLLRSPAFSV